MIRGRVLVLGGNSLFEHLLLAIDMGLNFVLMLVEVVLGDFIEV